MRYEASPFEFLPEIDLALHEAWFVDGMHMPDGLADYSACSWVADVVTHGFCWAAEKVSLPSCKGVIWRDYKAQRFIVTPIVVDSEDEIKEREVKFRQNLAEAADEFHPYWEKYKTELLDLYQPFKDFDEKQASPAELGRKLEDLRQVGFRMCEIHFWGMYLSFSFFMLFNQFCKQLGIDPASHEFAAMVRGFDNKSFECERELWNLSRKVSEYGLKSVFELPAHDVASSLRASGAGAKWLDELDSFLVEYGWRCERCWFPSSPSWQEDPRYAIRKVQDYLKLEDRNHIREKATKERERTIEQVIGRVSADKLDTFNLLLKGAQTADAFSEEHDLYCEMQTDALRRKFLEELGRRFVAAGTLDEKDDIYWLWLDETRKTSYWPEKWRLQDVVKERKVMAAATLEAGFPPVMTNNPSPEEAFGYMVRSGDPILLQVIVGELPTPRPELKADVLGVGGAPGIAEGPARVVFTDDQVGEVLPGEILVCPTTTIGWTTTFSLVKGVVVDRGGMLSHAAVVSRQYGIPCILNTFVGTSEIKTGQRIRIDGTQGAVYILND